MFLKAASLFQGRRRAGMSVTMGDFDNDGLLDLHTNEWLPHFLRSKQPDGSFASHARLLRNGAAGKPGFFEDVTEAAGVGMEQPGEAGLLRELRYKVKVTEAGWSTLSKFTQLNHVECLGNAFLDFRLRQASYIKWKGKIFGNGHVWE